MKRSLHIGINNYPGTNSDLSGCINDATDWKDALEERDFETVILLDNEATKVNMLAAITRIVKDTTKDDIAVITYSGHGTWVPDEDDDEADGRDEALCPHDIMEGNILTDDELYEIFGQRTWGARIIFISDSCHSGSVSRASNKMMGTEEDTWKFPKTRFLAPEIYLKSEKFKDNTKLLQTARRVENTQGRWNIRAATVLFSGCKDTEYSYDAWFNERANGAFTYAALQTLDTLDNKATYKEWFKEIRKLLPHVQYPQTPQLLASRYQKNTWKVFQA
ncbi:MAG: Unknown protein [uncultured Sulfurovum sp.]|uniref:Peptidase C14 caspase domain-containing protein n=1 Tax=uncultured Sulfurovum sp. TaxID=269237 RepID=A0A6S6SIF7_9BACT|nr:MAG: Unknown protein [uncultured Sulfurovum sp.]